MECNPNQLDSGHWHCAECGYTSKQPLDRPFRKACQPSDPAKPRERKPPGVGDHLKMLWQQLRIVPSKACGCESLRRKMNALGVDGCRANRAELVAELQAKSWDFSALDSLRAAGDALQTGLAWRINPLDRFGSLLDLAIERAESR